MLTLWQLCCCKLKVCCGQEMKATMSLLNKSFIKRNIYQGLPCHIDPLKVRSEVEAALMFLILNLIQQKKSKDILTRIDKKNVSWNQQNLFISIVLCVSFLDVTVEKAEEETPAFLNWPLYIFVVQSALAGFLVHMDILKVIVLKGKLFWKCYGTI